MKTRMTKKSAPGKKEEDNSEASKAKTQTLEASETNPPQVFILPKDTSAACRIISLPNPATSTSNRYLVCPDKGFYEFTRIAPPKRACRSWLLAPDRSAPTNDSTAYDEKEETEDDGYLLQSADLMLATPIDPLFVILPSLAHDVQEKGMQMYLTLSDYLEKLEEQSKHFQHVMRSEGSDKLEKIFDTRMLAVCDEMEAGDERLYRLSKPKLLEELVSKAKKMVAKGLPASLEERFVKQALVVPVLSIKREESSISLAEDDNATPGATDSETPSASTSQETQDSKTSDSTAATSITSTPAEETSTPSEEITHLLRLRTALNFLLSSYIQPNLRQTLETSLSTPDASPIDFTPLGKHISHLDGLKKEAQALRSLSENIGRKRGMEDDEDAVERAEAKKRKKEEEEFKKKNTSRGVQQLAKADTSGMKKLSSFFTKAPAKK